MDNERNPFHGIADEPERETEPVEVEPVNPFRGLPDGDDR